MLRNNLYITENIIDMWLSFFMGIVLGVIITMSFIAYLVKISKE